MHAQTWAPNVAGVGLVRHDFPTAAYRCNAVFHAAIGRQTGDVWRPFILIPVSSDHGEYEQSDNSQGPDTENALHAHSLAEGSTV